MSIIDLLVLGILIKRTKNAFEIVHFIRDNNLYRIVKVSEPAVFKCCRRLADAAYIDGKTVRVRGVPDKVVYKINNKGKARFYELMSHFSQDFKPFILEYNAVFWNIDNLKKADARKLLLKLQKQIHQVKDWIIEHDNEVQQRSKPLAFGPRQIIKQSRMTTIVLASWIDEAVIEFDKK